MFLGCRYNTSLRLYPRGSIQVGKEKPSTVQGKRWETRQKELPGMYGTPTMSFQRVPVALLMDRNGASQRILNL